ncbi:YfbR-like 5'-deoxynucleotidase [Staphylococcus equorum]|uniref:HD domain-containing protein n=1 Tax=Staphylococcus equorum TaxID=246432 RepID=A0A9X4R2M0_9STAP|nr:YfbR-like 5'-deoxynucleotidase [Staphylococcus equorum]MDG0860370.1 HD domain-containing protein [Staphylococcus equorum]
MIQQQLKTSELMKSLGDTTIMRLGEIIRYNNREKIKLENVAEHSLYVCSTVIKICNILNINNSDRAKSLEFAVTHDFGEIFLGDVAYDTKQDNPGLSQILEEAELKSLEKHMPEYVEIYRQFLKEEKEESLAYLITKLADTTSVLQYSNRELDLGNSTEEMKSINSGSVDRVIKLLEKIESKL